MTLCPIAIVAGCAKCPAFRICPAKELIGDYRPEPPARTGRKPSSTSRPKPKA